MAKRRRGTTPRGVNSVPEHLRCNFPLPNGCYCQAPRMKWGEDYHARCRHHKDHSPDELPLETLKDVRTFLADVMKRVRMEQMETKVGTAVSQIARELIKVIIADMKLDPTKAAQRLLTYEQAIVRAKSMTLDQARQITEQRNKSLLEDLLHEAEEVEVIDVSELDGPGKMSVTKAEKEIDRLIKIVEEGSPEEVLRGLDTFEKGKKDAETDQD